MTPRFISLIGTPYKTLDCWGIVKAFYKLEFDTDLKNYYEDIPATRNEAAALVYSSKGDFIPVTDLEYGDILLIKLEGIECHIAVYINNGQILHTTDHSGCVVDRYSKWAKLVVGTYRVEND